MATDDKKFTFLIDPRITFLPNVRQEFKHCYCVSGPFRSNSRPRCDGCKRGLHRTINLKILIENKTDNLSNLRDIILRTKTPGEMIILNLSAPIIDGTSPIFKYQMEGLNIRNEDVMRAAHEAHKIKTDPIRLELELLRHKFESVGGSIGAFIPPVPQPNLGIPPCLWHIHYRILKICYLEGESFDQFVATLPPSS